MYINILLVRGVFVNWELCLQQLLICMQLLIGQGVLSSEEIKRHMDYFPTKTGNWAWCITRVALPGQKGSWHTCDYFLPEQKKNYPRDFLWYPILCRVTWLTYDIHYNRPHAKHTQWECFLISWAVEDTEILVCKFVVCFQSGIY